MNAKRLAFAVSASFLLASSFAARAHEDELPGGKLGKVSFPTSCDPAVQPTFERAVAMLHSFWYNLAEKTFADILAQDPGCTVTAWGYSAILMSNPLGGVGASADGAKKAQAAIDNARRTPPKTQRERDYVEAVAAYYEDFANRPEKARQLARSKAFEALAAKYPDDDEAQIFSALYIAGTQSQADQTYAQYKKAIAILEPQFTKHPDHPGVAHYLIHSYDAPALAQQGLVAARRYASIAPDAPHALHMPSHIFTRVGSWEESIATNRRSATAARAAGDWPEAYHASDYEVYAYLQLGRDDEARLTMEEAMRYSGGDGPALAFPYAAAAMPARLAMERGDWKAAAQLQPIASKMPFTEALTYFARAIGAARSGDVAAAEKGCGTARRNPQAARGREEHVLGDGSRDPAPRRGGRGIAGEGNPEEGLKLMRASADLEDRNEKHIVTPGRIVPARELLGEMLLEQNQPAAALKEFETSQVREPNRFRNYAGSAKAAEAMGDKQKAAEYYAKLLELSKKADGNRPELMHAKDYVAQR